MAARNLTFLLFLALSMGAKAAPLTVEQKACTFKNTVLIGASITANTAMSIPLYHTAVSAMALRKGVFLLPPFGASPSSFLLMGYAKTGFFSSGWKNYSVMFTNSEEHLGSSQIRALVEGSERQVFNSASAIIGIDAFYWDAIFDNCGTGPTSAEQSIERLIQEARAKNIKMILGNVPYEDPSQVIIDSESIGIEGLWYRPKAACVASINDTLQRECVPQNGCYLIDLNDMATRLNNGEKLKLKNGAVYGLYSLRPDGVHLSTNGSIYVAERMVDALEANPPQCK